MDLLPVNPLSSLAPDSDSAAIRTADDSRPSIVSPDSQNKDEIYEIVPGRTAETTERSEPDTMPSDPRVSDSNSAKKNPGSTDLTPEEKEQVRELKEQDAKVRRHEQAHVMAGGRYIKSRAQFQFELGPDGKLYAVSGEVQIDTSKVPDDPEATIQKAQTVRRAALAPSDPSSQDRSVASEANRMEFEARMEITQQRVEELQPTDESSEEEQTNQSPPELNLLDLFV
jgi:hypothetical protein